MFGLDLWFSCLLLLCLFCVCAFEFINGFHDTANAVATVIYTKSLQPTHAVMLSGVLNGLGVYLGGVTVAMGIINMLPVESLVDQNTAHSLGMVAAILLTAIFWNFLTWYMGIPASSSHTLVGSILGVGIAYGLLPGSGAAAVNWHKAGEVGLSLLISPLFGFGLALVLLLAARVVLKNQKELFEAPDGDKPPPAWIRAILIFTCSLVSFSHGSNDGQKGIGLMLLILIGIIPAKFALDARRLPEYLDATVSKLDAAAGKRDFEKRSDQGADHAKRVFQGIDSLVELQRQSNGFRDASKFDSFAIRKQALLLHIEAKKLSERSDDRAAMSPVLEALGELKTMTDYSPGWVVLLIAISLGLGTMIGWKRIVITVGEKIGKSHLTYAQGASVELVAASTIAVSTYLGLPVSTTHVLSSGIAGAMFASGGQNNLERSTITKILLAWVLTLPVCITMAGTLFLIFRGLAP